MKIFIITACIVLFTVVLLPLIIAFVVMKLFIRRYDMGKYSFSLRIEDIENKYPVRHVSFLSGKNRLHGYVFEGRSADSPLVVICHGLFGGAEEYIPFAMHFADQGYYVFMYDNTGCNRSEGKSIKGTFQGLYDLNSAMKYIKSDKTLANRKRVLIGHSWGGFTAAAYPDKDSGFSCVVSLAGFDKPPLAITDFLSGSYGKIFRLSLPYCYIISFLRYGKMCFMSAIKRMNESGIPYLIIQGKNDVIIHYDSAAIYAGRNRVADKRTVFMLYDDEKHSKHDTIFRDADATEYMKSRYRLMKEIRKSKQKNTENALQRAWEETDRFRINRLDERFCADMDGFIEKYISAEHKSE